MILGVALIKKTDMDLRNSDLPPQSTCGGGVGLDGPGVSFTTHRVTGLTRAAWKCQGGCQLGGGTQAGPLILQLPALEVSSAAGPRGSLGTPHLTGSAVTPLTRPTWASDFALMPLFFTHLNTVGEKTKWWKVWPDHFESGTYGPQAGCVRSITRPSRRDWPSQMDRSEWLVTILFVTRKGVAFKFKDI